MENRLVPLLSHTRIHHSLRRRTRNRRTKHRIRNLRLPQPRQIRNTRPDRRSTLHGIPALRRSTTHRHLGVELRRLRNTHGYDTQPSLPRRRIHCPRHRLAILQQHLHRTLHAHPARKPRRILPILAHTQRRPAIRSTAHHLRYCRRQRALPKHPSNGFRTRRSRETIRYANLPQQKPQYIRMPSTPAPLHKSMRLLHPTTQRIGKPSHTP